VHLSETSNAVIFECWLLTGRIAEFQSVVDYPKYGNLGKILEAFQAVDIATLDKVTQLNEEDLKLKK